MLDSLYFSKDKAEAITIADVNAVDTKLGYPIPLNTFYHAGDYQIIGTTLDYFDLRGLEVARGHNIAILGDAVIGFVSAEMLLIAGSSVALALALLAFSALYRDALITRFLL